MPHRLKIAVIGGGIGGIAAAHKLEPHHDVELFEQSGRLGGHANSVSVKWDQKTVRVDTGFLIFNRDYYPGFVNFLRQLDVEDKIIAAEMSSCFSQPWGDYTLGLPRIPLRLTGALRNHRKLWRISKDLWKFRRRVLQDLRDPESFVDLQVGTYLQPYSEEFREALAYPLMSAIWSVPGSRLRQQPMINIIRYFANHGLIDGGSQKQWCTLKGSSEIYLQAFQRKFQGLIHLNSGIQSLRRRKQSIVVNQKNGQKHHFDRVVVATHADVALRLLEEPTVVEQKILRPWKYHETEATLHEDRSVLAANPKFWGSWNMRAREGDDHQISYYLNRLQELGEESPIILTLGQVHVDNSMVFQRFRYRHPLFDRSATETQALLPQLNCDRLAFCGSYHGFGFHEDALQSGLRAAESVLSR